MDTTLFKFVIPIYVYEDKQYNSIRKEELLLIANIFDFASKLLNTRLSSYSLTDEIIRIELSCYKHAVDDSIEKSILINWANPLFEDLYRCTIARVTKNLDVQSEVNDSYLFKSIVDGMIDVDNISRMKSEEFSPKQTLIIVNTLKTRMEQKLTRKTTKLYTCRKCKKNQCTMKMYQSRSLDEAQTISVRCDYCSSEWTV